MESLPQQSRHWFLPDGRVVFVLGGKILGTQIKLHPYMFPQKHDDVAQNELRTRVANAMGFDLVELTSWPRFLEASGGGLPSPEQLATSGLLPLDVELAHLPHSEAGAIDLRLHVAERFGWVRQGQNTVEMFGVSRNNLRLAVHGLRRVFAHLPKRCTSINHEFFRVFDLQTRQHWERLRIDEFDSLEAS